MWACLCMFVCVCGVVGEYMYASVVLRARSCSWRLEDNLRSHSSSPSTFRLILGSLVWNVITLARLTGQWASRDLLVSTSHLSIPEITDAHHRVFPFSALGSGDWAKDLMLVSAFLMNNISPAPFSTPLKAPASSLKSVFPGQWLCSSKEWYKTALSWEQVDGAGSGLFWH